LKAFLAGLARVWYTDDNAIVRQKVDEAIVVRRAPMLNAIVRQGIEEGTFTTLYPEQAGEIILALASGLGNTIGRLMLAYRPEHPQDAEVIAATYAAYANAIERALGARARFLACPNADMVREWLA
jgi:hypothetical protein